MSRSFHLAYNYTNVYFGDSTQLTYLRSRYYSSGTGRFLTRDTWEGNINRPMSFNRWMYVEGNPVNRVDPTGYNWQPTNWCQMMPTKGLYESCILFKYGLEPISIFELGKSVQGQQGCYSGPSEYRAPGYLEGVEAHIGGIPSYTTGIEVVYDFARMERASFDFRGATINDGLVGGEASVYFGKILGLKSDTDVIEDYRAVSISASVGISFDVGIGGAVGRGGFVATSSDTIPMLRGKTWYLGGSLSGDFVEGFDLSGSWVNYTPISAQPISYVRADESIDTARLYADIFAGTGSPWGSPQWDIAVNPELIVAKSAVRAYGFYLANKYIAAYEDLHNDNP